MHRHFRSAILVLLTVYGTPPLTAQQSSIPAALTGTITSADAGAPVRKAQVRLVGTTSKLTLTAISDASGRFTFSNVPPGEYMLKGWKPGYLDMVLGARRPGRNMPGTRITLAPGQKVEGLTLKIPRGGVLSGVVTDEFGDPALNVPVRAMKVIYENGRRSVYPSGNAVTDDLGGYRIAGLEPGDYYVSAVPRDSVAAIGAMQESFRQVRERVGPADRLTATARAMRASFEDNLRERGGGAIDPDSSVGYVPVFFPGTASSSAATPVRLGVGEQAGGVDIQLQSVESASVRGTVLTPDGKPTTARVQLLDPNMPIANLGVYFRNADGSGRFSFRGLAPGPYLLLTQKSQPGNAGELTASATVVADASGGDDVTLLLQPGVAVAGRLDLSTLAPGVFSKLRVRLDIIPGVDHWESPAISATPDAEGHFVARGVAPGHYRVVVSGLPAGHHIASATFNGVDVADRNLVIERRENVSGGVITFTARAGELTGSLSNSGGDPVSDFAVLLFPSERALWVPQSRRIQLVQPNPDGQYVIRDLPPGDYRIAAIPPPDAGQQYDIEFLNQIASGAEIVTVGPGERRTRDLRVP